jgi:hypothetical protein
MYKADGALEVPVSRQVLVITAGRTIVGETQAMPGAEVRVQQSLISTIKADPALRERQQGIVIAHVWLQRHDTAIEAIRPTNIWYGRERGLQIEKFIWRSERHYVRVDIDQVVILCLAPQSNLRKRRFEVCPAHQV